MTRRAFFEVHEGDARRPSMAVDCRIEWSDERGCWRAYDEHGNEGLSQYQPLAAARCFAARMERDGGHLDEDDPAPIPDPRAPNIE